uniref:Transmembrane protein n=1 Tax=Panagrellus redivivus TaxID=6233 RepID=A0A7E4WC08_PANRE
MAGSLHYAQTSANNILPLEPPRRPVVVARSYNSNAYGPLGWFWFGLGGLYVVSLSLNLNVEASTAFGKQMKAKNVENDNALPSSFKTVTPPTLKESYDRFDWLPMGL